MSMTAKHTLGVDREKCYSDPVQSAKFIGDACLHCVLAHSTLKSGLVHGAAL